MLITKTSFSFFQAAYSLERWSCSLDVIWYLSRRIAGTVTVLESTDDALADLPWYRDEAPSTFSSRVNWRGVIGIIGDIDALHEKFLL